MAVELHGVCLVSPIKSALPGVLLGILCALTCECFVKVSRWSVDTYTQLIVYNRALPYVSPPHCWSDAQPVDKSDSDAYRDRYYPWRPSSQMAGFGLYFGCPRSRGRPPHHGSRSAPAEKVNGLGKPGPHSFGTCFALGCRHG